MFEPIVRRGTLIAVAALIVCVLGLAAALRIPVQMIPDLEVRTITVRTDWRGATPRDIEQEILIEQEEYLRSVASLRRMVSEASSGEARIELEFPFDIDVTETLIRVNNALSQVPSYPENVDQPRVYAASFSANAFMYFRVTPVDGNPRRLDMDMMRDFVDDYVRPRMESVPEVSQVRVGGGADRQIQVFLDPAALAALGISIGEVRAALRARNRDVSGGELESGKRRYLLRTIGRFDDVEALDRLILRRNGDSVVRLGDVARVRLDHSQVREISRVDGRPVIGLSVRREPGSNVIAIKQGLLEEMERINRDVLAPAGMELRLTSDDVAYVQASLRNVWINLAIGAALACAVLYLFLRSGRATLAAVAGIPICTITAFLGLLIFGRTINVISLAGVAFAIGMTLDNSIVVLESIDLERRRGLGRFRAAVEGVRRVWPAVVASTLTTVLVFAPIVLIQEEAGQLYSDVAIAVSASILASMLVAMTVVPAACAHIDLKGAADASGGRFGAAMARLVDAILATRARRLSMVAGTVAASAAVIVFLTPPAEYLPEGEEAKTFASMNAPPGYNLTTMAAIGEELQEYFLPFVGDDPARFAAGETAVPAMAYLNMQIEPQRVRIITESVDPSQIDALMAAITRKYAEYPGMRAFASRGSIITSNDGGTRSVGLDISGPSLEDVYAVASAAVARAERVFDGPRVQIEPPTLSLSQPLIEVRPDWDRAAELGLDLEDLGFAVSVLTNGAFADEFLRDDRKIDIYFYGRDGPATDLDAVRLTSLHTPQGAVVPLESVARVVETVDTNTIRRIDGRRTVSVFVIPPASVALETGVETVRRDVVEYLRDAGRIPLGVDIDLSGASDQLDATREALLGNYAVAAIVIYLLLVAIFGHWGHPMLIMTTIPIGVAGGLVGLALMNLVGGLLPAVGLAAIRQPFDMISMLGFLILMGTVVNNPILVVHRAMDNARDGRSSPREVVREAVASRLRPIAMSTITTICGLAPLVFFPGEGTELYRGVGAIVLFGILGTALVTVTFLPALTVTVLTARARWSERRVAAAAE